MPLCLRLLRRRASESECLCQREEGHGGGSRRRSVLMFPTLYAETGRTATDGSGIEALSCAVDCPSDLPRVTAPRCRDPSRVPAESGRGVRVSELSADVGERSPLRQE
jgi:hypothetical protein